jgi:ferredoxin-NADP reductase/fatty acid desaturase
MTAFQRVTTEHPSLAEQLQALYDETRAAMGEQDLAQIRQVAAYSKAIKARSRELLMKGAGDDALKKGVALYMLHILLEFSELGHNIMHGSYDHLPDAGEFHSSRWQWDFVTDPREWKVMHHQNHHPFTNIVGKDHDLGYSIARLLPYQSWFGHHALQPGVLVLLLLHMYHFTIYTATSAARTEGRKVLSTATFRRSLDMIAAHARQNYVKEPLESGRRFFHTLFGNYLGTALGYDLTILILILEHHAPNVQVFPDPGPGETRDDYFRRQLLATSNFIPMGRLDAYFSRLLEEEVPFENRPSFEVFYGGLTTHVEHHLFPDLPCQRQREIVPKVREICLQHGIPYNVVALEDVLPDIFKSLFKWAAPLSSAESTVRDLIRQPKSTLTRLMHGLRYRTPSATTYLKAPRFYNADTKVLSATPLAEGDALSLTLARPYGWDTVTWDAGAFVSVRVVIGGEEHIRQYSLTEDSTGSDTLNICVKRVKNGLVSNYINDYVKTGDYLTLANTPQNGGAFAVPAASDKTLLVAGGVGITPLISMLRAMRRRGGLANSIVLYFNRAPSSILFENELRVLAASHGVEIHFFCDGPVSWRSDLQQGSLGEDVLDRLVPDLAERQVYACAPGGMLDALGRLLAERGVPADHYHTESFSAPLLDRDAARAGVSYQVSFARSGVSVSVDGASTLLEASRLAGLKVPSGCERGLCKACVCTKLTGKTLQESASGRQESRITICNALPDSDIVLDL